jgi:tripartite ATP-independent transporter DctM subunit
MVPLADLLDVLMFITLCGVLLLGYPVAFTLAGVALAFALLGAVLGVFDAALLRAIPQRVFGIVTNETLLAIPLFVIMGVILEKSDIARTLLHALERLFQAARAGGGSLGLAVVLVATLLAASTGIVGATVVTLTLLALPTLLARGYPASLAGGLIAASGTLGQVIPPSIVLIILADQMGHAGQQAAQANPFARVAPVSVSDLFAGALLPGVLLACAYAFYVWWRALRLSGGQDAPNDLRPHHSGLQKEPGLWQALVAPLGLIVAVLGSILAGLATATEAAAMGALGAVLLSAMRQAPETGGARRLVQLGLAAATGLAIFAVLWGDVRHPVFLGVALCLTAVLILGLLASLFTLLRMHILWPATQRSLEIVAMIFAIVIGASLFVLVFRGLGGDALVQGLLENVPGGTLGAVFAVMLVIFLLGFFLDFLEIMFIIVPLAAPILLQMPMPDGSAMSPIWLGVLIAVNLQTSFLTPPFGFALFYLRGSLDTEMAWQLTSAALYRGVVPFVLIQLGMLALLWFAPVLATGLPAMIYK